MKGRGSDGCEIRLRESAAFCLRVVAGGLLTLMLLGCSRGRADADKGTPVGSGPPLEWKSRYIERGKYDEAVQHPAVAIETSMGDITIELLPSQAPKTVENFLRYVDSRFYDGLIVHRVIPDFMVQTGAFGPGMEYKEGSDPIENEAGNGLSNLRGTVAMARLPEPHTASTQFFINLVDNTYLDHTDDSQDGFGYCVFGGVIGGMDVVDAIAAVRTRRSQGSDDVPARDIVVEAIRRAGGTQ